jgi:thymidylate synthase ThyX
MSKYIKLLPPMGVDESASHAARICYSPKIPKLGELIDVLKSLFKPGHMTTLSHAATFETYEIEGIAVGDITFGLHLTHPFYNTDQRSGRYAGEMFSNPNFEQMMAYVMEYWPETSPTTRGAILSYLQHCAAQYTNLMPEATDLARKHILKLRPFISKKDFDKKCENTAQEQVRVVIPTLFPTALVFTVNLVALVAMYEEAWTPGMKDMTQQMVDKYCEKHPDARKYFNTERRRTDEFALAVPAPNDVFVALTPSLTKCEVYRPDLFILPSPEIMHPVDRLHFRPELMDNNIGSITSEVTVSLATYGQDQRHRTVRRSQPVFTGGFYLPPLLQKVDDAQSSAESLMKKWTELAASLPKTLGMLLAPYGAMVRYTKQGSFNAKLHELGKRTCLQAQEEIRYLTALERNEVSKLVSPFHSIMHMYQPHCFETGTCAEGGRFCGRDLRLPHTEYFQRWIV